MRPPVSKGRAGQFVHQLIALDVIDRDAASIRGIRIRDVVKCRDIIGDALGEFGWWRAPPLGQLLPPSYYTTDQLPEMPPFEHLPEID